MSDKIQNKRLTMEFLSKASDEQLLDLLRKSKGHSKDFSKFMNSEFSYDDLAKELRSRGYETGWHKTGSAPSVKPIYITMEKDRNVEYVRLSLTVDKNIDAQWKKFSENYKFNTVLSSNALKQFMEDVRSGRIKIVIKND